MLHKECFRAVAFVRCSFGASPSGATIDRKKSTTFILVDGPVAEAEEEDENLFMLHFR